MPLLSDLRGCALRNQRDAQETKGGYVTTLGTGGPGHKRALAEGRSRASQLLSLARLLKRVVDIDMRRCPSCGGGELKIIAAIPARPVIEKILTHLGLDPQPPPKGRAREARQDLAT